MTRTVADASRDYRKRKADKIARYEAALERIFHDSPDLFAQNVAQAALGHNTALNQEMGRGL